MNNIRITKQFAFEAAHALYGYDGKCKNIHGHNYVLYVTVIGTPITDTNDPKYGMGIDFGDLKSIVKREIVDVFDHAMIINKNSPHKQLGDYLVKEGHHIIVTDYQPSCEMMIIDFAEKIKAQLPKGVKLHALKLDETPTSYAEWFAEDN